MNFELIGFIATLGLGLFLFSWLIFIIERAILALLFLSVGGFAAFILPYAIPVLLLVGLVFLLAPPLSTILGIQIILVTFLIPALQLIGLYVMGAGFVLFDLEGTGGSQLLNAVNVVVLVCVELLVAPPLGAMALLLGGYFLLFASDLFWKSKLNSETNLNHTFRGVLVG
jgi:hypothetical protein